MAPCVSTCKRRQAGFSLLETIAAILLLALAFGAVMHVAGAATNLTSHARELNRVAMFADETLASVGKRDALREGVQRGWYDSRYRWQLTTRRNDAFPARTPDLHLYRIDLDILWRDGGSERRAHFATLRLQDEPAPAAAPTVAAR
ncbi:prepilin-type N-terminal cleavage/methylation domain-containing protein [Luteibacter yeojuensis]|uniref:General secretion pathway protein I n=1 Tax=Luteibacter yeojuensis TaxID=345309 RepID=A0A0F3KR76_9GAMM|nr:prepilin-type N-terminal cleavage/methylation domain-containing protein [Luteibacter yeojuensis]KJV33765.1 hypothetical protein VI08_10380 [Luteibacter yeojuensis]